ncbi:VQ motif-containing protein 9 [Lotus japonicus]|uniref:VQ motif-containing protein 9 n=1 Tax=Lotus japonicus TaxID=34305 RepID=UPI002586EB03|nr:VQ motif-containing protein 9 [Lotus japonicus]
MDKSCQQSSADSTSSRDHYLRHLNKLSQKISKPIIKKQPTFHNNLPPPPPPPPPPQNPPPPPPQQHQPPVYNINKNDFRDVVQKLTGSPAHDRISTPPPIQQPKPQSSRLQRIRPPPLPQITNRPPQLMNSAMPRSQPPQNPGFNFNFNAASFSNAFTGFGRPSAPLSPLPPFPTVHAPAESPISAYMRDLQFLLPTMDSKNFSGFSPLPPPASSQPPPEQQAAAVSQSQSQSPFQMPSSPFGCLNSPMSSYPLLSPGRLPFSPNSGQLGFPQLPLSPTVPVPSPRWRGL